MIEGSQNPWVERFHPFLDEVAIKERALFRPAPLKDLQAMPKEWALRQLYQALEAAFYPTTQCVRILQRWLSIAYAHCQGNYSGHVDYLGRLYQKKVEIMRGTHAMCLTGLGGVGKTALINAAKRVFPPTMKIVTKDGMFVPLESCRIMQMEVRTNPNDLLREFCGGTGSGKDLTDQSRRLAFTNGIAFVFADEFQFNTLTTIASAQITKMLLALNSLGIPFVYAANFSMLHTLNKRNQQERQRLNADITEFVPDQPDSEDWRETLALLKEIAPETFVFDPVKDAITMHGLCAGMKRAMAKLLVIAYSSVHHKGYVGIDELTRAYKAGDYASDREDVLALQYMTTDVRRKRKDLWNPFRSVNDMAEQERQNSEKRQEHFADSSTLAAMPKAERKEHAQAIRQKPAKAAGIRNRDVTKSKLTAEELKRNMQLFRDGLKGG
ncbi:hypothetical protein [Dechloromonas denitrificans]|uniref:hypothetical protein n=1 Tax=Dechloromonas denitrificans TaxID=281362 RepID=UPI001CF95E88|nr:hypothetical protein [Dechloromonas denitrificans]UCV08544.1 hypothetical protein KI615_03150 [Dechloromonas denitrificans]